jgi:syntaxin-binding protein 1
MSLGRPPSHLCHVVIEAITNYREPQPSMEAIYLVMPTTQNIDRIIRDFSNGRQQYGGGHLFFIDGMYVPFMPIRDATA